MAMRSSQVKQSGSAHRTGNTRNFAHYDFISLKHVPQEPGWDKTSVRATPGCTAKASTPLPASRLLSSNAPMMRSAFRCAASTMPELVACSSLRA